MRTRRRRFGVDGRRWSVAVGAVVLAFGVIALARARAPDPAAALGFVVGGRSAGTAEGPARLAVHTPEMDGFVALTQSAVIGNGVRDLYAEIRLEAHGEGQTTRRPVAIAVALDTSGSMSGEKIIEARRSVRELIARMRPTDRVALVTYDHRARLLSPLMLVADLRAALPMLLQQIQAGGGTNIPGGLELAARSLANAPGGMVRRLVLISDGQDGSGIELSSVSQSLGSRAREGVTTSALGVGVDYDERWLSTVADAGRGNYAFLAGGAELTQFLTRELEQASSTVADQTELALTLPAGWRVAESHGAAVSPGSTTIPLGSLFAGERRRVTLRLEAVAGASGSRSEIGVALRYRALVSEVDRNLPLGRLSVAMVGSQSEVAASMDVTLHAEAVAAHVDAQQALAVDAWREGRREEAARISRGNVLTLQQWGAAAPAAARGIALRQQAVERDLENFQQLDAHSQAGRAYGLGSNSVRRARLEAF